MCGLSRIFDLISMPRLRVAEAPSGRGSEWPRLRVAEAPSGRGSEWPRQFRHLAILSNCFVKRIDYPNR
jgi:hypothetical protein